ncbi:MAG TPA: phytanoyl-CoA dioxygenase family protein [Chloroflexota bacterium]|jgi:ectoine hydroxylase-related dioxygenase (phytanoyl-CoA dioxygenase family)|nr:phytanoyl-CoA dioxygenase family protein [Chloroflexota bacterium]
MLAQQVTLTADQKAHFDTFGYLVMPGFLSRTEIAHYTDAFMDVYRREWGQEEFDPKFAVQRPGASGVRHQIIPFFARDERFLPLLDHPGLNDLIEQLLGEDCLLMTPGEGFVAATDSIWHTDSRAPAGFTSLKVAFYLDPVGAGAGCLNVLPGSHQPDHSARIRQALEAGAWGGVASPDVPTATPLPSQPGDMIVFNHQTWHSSFGGKPGRRSIMINYFQHPTERWHANWITGLLHASTKSWADRLFPEEILKGASERRMRKIQKLLDMGF